ncbi:sialic acid-binding Ig-like lectin 13 isoform X2 [Scyliorhinus canicula]|uniref:sialic acid-binding Ig-like lectin 13 isoform X2 n=1 Tax=Scyliorhinus canicula TaxID=7830 RepID=UPI0018F3AF1C|nr:sialic acid-binding Ig-like lectin 13 isoform X2 [Scyliorhinus canicula]
MQFLLMLLLILQTGVQGVQIIGEVSQPQLVSVLRGESVTINCTFIYHGTDVNWIHTNWYRNTPGSNYSYEMNKPTCSPDVSLGGLTHCVVSLKIENVSFEQSDSNYICVAKMPLIYPPIERRGQGTRIQIYEPPKISTIDSPLVAGRKSHLTCSVKALYSENISFTWTCHGTNSFTNITAPTSKRTVNGTSVTSSQLEIIPNTADHGIICTCQINHVTFRQLVATEIKLHVMYAPQNLSIMYRLSNGSNYQPLNSNSITVATYSFLELKCGVDSNPVSTVNWVKDNKNDTEVIQIESGLNNSNLKITYLQLRDGGTYWCMANNSYGSGNSSVWINAVEKDYLLLFVLVPIIAVVGFISVITICFSLIWKRQLKDPVHGAVKISPETMDRCGNFNSESDIIYASVRRDNLPTSPKHSIADYIIEYNNIEEENEEVSYADIVIHNPKRQGHNQWPKHTPDIKEKNTGKDFKHTHGSSPHKHVDDTSEYSAIRISHQDLRTA